MTISSGIEIPEPWKRVPIDLLDGLIMVIGGPNTGKTTFARFLRQRLQDSGRQLAFLDGDPGQSECGPPTTLTLELPPSGGSRSGSLRWFIGSTSPRGHMLEMLVGLERLCSQIPTGMATIYDSSGLVDPRMGGYALKIAKIQLLQPRWLFAIQIESELEPVLAGLPRRDSMRIVRFQPAAAASIRSPQVRQQKRTENYSRYFQGAHRLRISWRGVAVHPGAQFAIHRLVSLEDEGGFSLALGIVLDVDRSARELTLLTPLKDPDGVAVIHPGDVYLEPQSYRDWKAG